MFVFFNIGTEGGKIKLTAAQPQSIEDRSQYRQHKRAEQPVGLVRTKRTLALRPPVQHKNERRGDVLDKNGGWNLASRFPAALKSFSDVLGNQVSNHLLKVLMNDGSPLGSHSCDAGVAVAVVVLEDREAEPDDVLVPLRW